MSPSAALFYFLLLLLNTTVASIEEYMYWYGNWRYKYIFLCLMNDINCHVIQLPVYPHYYAWHVIQIFNKATGHSLGNSHMILFAGLRARRQYAFGSSYHRSSRRKFSWFFSISKQMLRWFPSSKLLLRALMQPSRFKFIRIKPFCSKDHQTIFFITKFGTNQKIKNDWPLSYYYFLLITTTYFLRLLLLLTLLLTILTSSLSLLSEGRMGEAR
jgi:hypothetical protein